MSFIITCEHNKKEYYLSSDPLGNFTFHPYNSSIFKDLESVNLVLSRREFSECPEGRCPTIFWNITKAKSDEIHYVTIKVLEINGKLRYSEEFCITAEMERLQGHSLKRFN